MPTGISTTKNLNLNLNHMKPILIIALMWCSLSSCGRNSNQENVQKIRLMAPSEKDMTLRVADPGPADKSDTDADETTVGSSTDGNIITVSDTSKKIVKEGEVSFETTDIIATHKTITDSLKKLGGYVAEEKQTNNNGDNRKQDVLNIRIPARNFDTFLSAISSSAVRIDQKDIRITDVTAHFIDISTQLKTNSSWKPVTASC